MKQKENDKYQIKWKETLSEYLYKVKNYLRKQTRGRDEDYLKAKISNKKKRYNKL